MCLPWWRLSLFLGTQTRVQTALQLFMERGYAETSIGDVAEQAGLLKGNLSYYFKTKAELYRAAAWDMEEVRRVGGVARAARRHVRQARLPR